MESRARQFRHALIVCWTLAVVVFVYLPSVCIALASLTASRYFQFPISRWGLDWWQKTFNSIEIRQLLSTSISIALCVTVIAVAIAFFGALAFARYDWRGRSLYQKIILLPIFFPQSVLGLALLAIAVLAVAYRVGKHRAGKDSSWRPVDTGYRVSTDPAVLDGGQCHTCLPAYRAATHAIRGPKIGRAHV